MMKRQLIAAFALCPVFISSLALGQADAPPREGNNELFEPAMVVEAPRVDDAPSMRLKALADSLTILKSRGVAIVDATRVVRADILQTAQEDAVFNGAAGTRIMQVKDEGTLLIAWRFENNEALTINARLRPDAIQLGNELLMPATCSESEWLRIKAALCEESTRHESQLVKGGEAAAALAMLNNIRAQVRTFTTDHGRTPDFANLGWREMIEGGYLAVEPTSPLSTCIDRAHILTFNEPNQNGLIAPVNEAAWVWNSATKTVFIAGFDEQSLAQRVEEQAQLLADLRTLQLDAAEDGAEWMKERIVRGEIASMRSMLQQQFSKNANGSYPTLSEVRSARSGGAAGEAMRRIGINPYNGSDAVQQATWNENQPPVFGDAGWNYDPNTGKFWANTTVAGVNEF